MYVLCRGQILFIRPDLATTQCPSVGLLLVSTHVLINIRQHSPTLNLCIITLWPLYSFCTLQPRRARQSSGTRNLLQCFDVKALICSKEGIPPVKQRLIFTLKTIDYWGWTFTVSLQCTKWFTLIVCIHSHWQLWRLHQVRLFLCSKLKKWCGDSEGQSAAKDGLSANSLITKWNLRMGILLLCWTLFFPVGQACAS